MTEDEEIRISWSGEFFEVELHDESLTNETLVRFKSADTIEEAVGIVRQWLSEQVEQESRR